MPQPLPKPAVILSRREFYVHAMDGDEYDTIGLSQNMEAPDADHWLIELNLTRWRTRAELATYLRDAAEVVEGL